MAKLVLNQRALATAAVAACVIFLALVMMSNMTSAERLLKDKKPKISVENEMRPGFLVRMAHFLWQSGESSYEPIWPVSLH